MDIWGRHCTLIEELGWKDHFTPKYHLMVHLTFRMSVTGNAWLHACFLDESLNKLLKQATKFAHSANFESVVFTKLTDMLERDAKNRKEKHLR